VKWRRTVSAANYRQVIEYSSMLRAPRHPLGGTTPKLRPRRLRESKPAASAIACSRNDEVTELPGYQINLLSLTLDKVQKPYYCGTKNSHQRCLTTTALLGLAPARSTRAYVANHRESISACRRDDLGVANSNVTTKATNHVCPQHSRDTRGGRLRRAEITE
jgi:hypothetical protein